MAAGVGKIVGNGKNTKILDSIWVGDKQIMFKSCDNNMQEDQPIWVSDLLKDNKHWDEDILNKWFEPQTIKMIKTIHIPEDDLDDELRWTGTKHGNYITKSGYWFDVTKNAENPKAILFWKRFWSQKFWPKWKFFYWKLAHGALATGVNLRRRKILSDNPCPFCGREEESDTHLFRDCEITKRIWSCSNLGINATQASNLSIALWTRNWLWYFMKENSKDDEKTFEFMGILWSIWLIRNKKTFNPNSQLVLEDAFDIMKQWKDRAWKISWEATRIVNEEITNPAEDRTEQHYWSSNWSNQIEDATLIVDGAWKANEKLKDDPGTAAFGWVIQEKSEEVAQGGKIINANSAAQSEALGMLLCIKEGRKKEIRNLEVWTDSKILVDGLRKTKNVLSTTKTIILDIKKLAKNFNSFRILNVSRDKVKKANLIAVTARKEGFRV
ncbi:uncharacterized protein LOC125496647 [Beta vulgaris subsp. vulgaris]|uniref:uncharacterized protein LOC125496647 n=1 Tax=Beta vulgaris subsp. vulgaris TaxID=3555 RepID=UPI00203688DF|nr:uncharacterized protein LOC125496647 [Beta vulgaris subsp. vulgaris]